MSVLTMPAEYFDSVRPVRVAAVAGFGFTERQARFLVTVMVHSGVLLERQYLQRRRHLSRPEEPRRRGQAHPPPVCQCDRSGSPPSGASIPRPLQTSKWAKCKHPWHFSFYKKRCACPTTCTCAGNRVRVSLHKVAKKPLTYWMSKSEPEGHADALRGQVRDGAAILHSANGDTRLTLADGRRCRRS